MEAVARLARRANYYLPAIRAVTNVARFASSYLPSFPAGKYHLRTKASRAKYRNSSVRSMPPRRSRKRGRGRPRRRTRRIRYSKRPRKKRFGRSFRRKSQWNIKRRRPVFLGAEQPMIKRVKMRSTTRHVASDFSNVSAEMFSCGMNTMLTPMNPIDATAVPCNFVNLSNGYGKYRVLWSSLTVRFYNPSDAPVLVGVIPSRFDGTTAILAAIPSPEDIFCHGKNGEKVRLNRGKSASSGGHSITRNSIQVSKMRTQARTMVDDDKYYVDLGSSCAPLALPQDPSDIWYWNIYLYRPDGTTLLNLTGTYMIVELTQVVEMYKSDPGVGLFDPIL